MRILPERHMLRPTPIKDRVLLWVHTVIVTMQRSSIWLSWYIVDPVVLSFVYDNSLSLVHL